MIRLLLLVAALSAGQPLLGIQGSYRAHSDIIRKVYAALPARGKSVPCEVREVRADDWPLVDDLEDMKGIIGIYLGQSRRIYLQGDDEEEPYTFAHEFGHHVYAQSFAPRERRDWARFWNRHLSGMNSDYARVSASEGFAEAYASTYGPFDPDAGTLSPAVDAKIRSYFP